MALSPEKMNLHPDWNSSDTSYDADIAIMTFESGEIPSSKFIQPICLWNDDTPQTQTEGYVGGWRMNRKSENAIEEIPTNFKLPIHINAHCWYREPNLLAFSGPRTFCAGETDGVRKNSGGEMSIKVGLVFYFQGIVSTGLLDEIGYNITKFIIFTEVLKFQPWIDQTMSKDDVNLLQVVYQANLKCTIDLSLWKEKNVQTCNIFNQKIDGEGFSVARDLDQSIQAFEIHSIKEVKCLPENIAESFPDQVVNCSIRTVNRKHFKALNELEYLRLARNEIESIDGDSFKDLTKLERLYLECNKIETIDPS